MMVIILVIIRYMQREFKMVPPTGQILPSDTVIMMMMMMLRMMATMIIHDWEMLRLR